MAGAALFPVHSLYNPRREWSEHHALRSGRIAACNSCIVTAVRSRAQHYLSRTQSVMLSLSASFSGSGMTARRPESSSNRITPKLFQGDGEERRRRRRRRRHVEGGRGECRIGVKSTMNAFQTTKVQCAEHEHYCLATFRPVPSAAAAPAHAASAAAQYL